MSDTAAPLTLHQLARALACHAVHTTLAHRVREVGNSDHCPTRSELIDQLATLIEVTARAAPAD